MSSPSKRKETGATPFYRSAELWAPVMVVSCAVASWSIAWIAVNSFNSALEEYDAKIARGRLEWRQAHKEVSCDFGRGIKFSVVTEESADVPEGLRPALTAGLATGACRPAGT